jgi:hypothetical protein
MYRDIIIIKQTKYSVENLKIDLFIDLSFSYELTTCLFFNSVSFKQLNTHFMKLHAY